ncbi:MAG: glycoside hydrolase family 3 C-terminal domain-containing protein [Candidatus Heimdallarchaeota archaeon]|nr:glycoside hydrolase family 3 C-terminal domain-containing protein [Candidatus Heimdallarchaeota archaeon]MBY8994255.1 glycoside hydrolase family 3 C-terminal domain-containing protein [Candidatus Heimdallarchaeota archaeon]
MVKKQPSYFDEALDLEKRVDNLLKNLALNEKLKLLSSRRFTLWTTKPIRRLKIKRLGMTDGPIGVATHSSYRLNTKFPCSKNLSSTWNRTLAYEYGLAIAKETRAVGRHIVLGPGINIDRTPLNGRTFEYFSEDPYLTKEMAVPFVKGVQSQRIGACIKHYAANNQEENRFHVNAVIEERTLNEIYLKAYKDVVEEADPWVFMSCYNKVNGIFGCEHKGLLRDTLMDTWGFKGFVVTDWWATRRLEKPEESILAGLSLEMPSIKIYKPKLLKKALNEGKIAIEDIDYVLRRLLRVMFLVGLFDEPEKIPKGERNTREHQDLARKVAEEGIVLLKNEKKILPLDENKIKTLAVLGSNADKKMSGILYGGAASVVPKYEITPLQGLKEKCEGKVQFTSNVEAADACILVVGLNHARGNDCEDVDRTRLELPEEQIKLIKDTVKRNPNTIVVLINGSPVAMNEWIDSVPAIVEVWYPGQESGRAIAKILFGDVNPSGKLPITFPKKLSDSPAHKSDRTYPGAENVYYEEGIFVGYRHFDEEKIEPLFPFGFGLSYTAFEYENCKTDKNSITSKDKVTITVDIKNTGDREGSEIVQLYVKDDKSSVKRPEKELKNFEKINLKPNEKKEVKFKISVKDLEFYDTESHSWKHEKGEFTILIGSSSRNIHFKQKIELK